MKPHFHIIALIACLFGIAACTPSETSPEQQIRAFIDQALAAAEDRSSSDVMELVSPAFTGAQGLTAATLKSRLQLYFFRHKNIHLFKRIEQITLHSTEEASVSVYVAMAGSVIADASVLGSLRAQIYHFDLSLRRDDTWRVSAARWRPASAADLQRSF